MQTHRVKRWRAVALGGLLALVAAIGITPAVLSAALRSDTVVLYNGALGTSPAAQGLAYRVRGGQARETVAGGATTVDSTGNQSVMAGYLASAAGLGGWPAQLPQLERAKGCTITFAVQVQQEYHTGSKRNNDALDDRAGFSVIALSSDHRGIELGFWLNRIWAQEGGVGDKLFTQAEGIAFNTSARTITYELTLRGDMYQLSAGSAPILSGVLRDYTAFAGPVDLYDIPNFVFVGDNTESARARFRIAFVQVAVEAGAAAALLPHVYLPMVKR